MARPFVHFCVGVALLLMAQQTSGKRPADPKSAPSAFLEEEPAEDEFVAGQDGTFSQNYQDTWALALAQHNGWDKSESGFFLDLGAYHGTWCSNSRLLEKKLGWKGICVEPLPVGFEDRSCVLAARALSDVPDQTKRFFGHDQEKHIGKREWEDRSEDMGTDIRTLTIGELLNCANGTVDTGNAVGDCRGVQGRALVPDFIHLVSLDVEGLESNILSTFPWSKVKVGAWIVEQTNDRSRPPEKQELSRKILLSHGYLKAPVENPGVDEYYVLPEFWHESLASKAWRVHPEGSHGC